MNFNSTEAIIIPAYKPAESMLELIKSLKELNAENIIIIDDGSGSEFSELFERAEGMGCILLPHAVNQGKGRALKTAFNYLLSKMPGVEGAVTADADGQHTAQDILKCAVALRSDNGALIMGCRDFNQSHVPARSAFGNKLTRSAMKSLCGVAVTDTQTGLRALGRGFMARLITVAGERYEFETNMLLETRRENVPIKEVTIQTVYLNNNESSHFNPIRDSIKIYALLFKFVAASLASSVVDILMFSLFVLFFKPLGFKSYILAATVSARVISAIFNYFVNKNIVFESKKNNTSSGVKYILLCAVQMAASAGLVTLIYSWLPVPEVLIKVPVDLILFLISFQIQRRFIF